MLRVAVARSRPLLLPRRSAAALSSFSSSSSTAPYFPSRAASSAAAAAAGAEAATAAAAAPPPAPPRRWGWALLKFGAFAAFTGAIGGAGYATHGAIPRFPSARLLVLGISGFGLPPGPVF